MKMNLNNYAFLTSVFRSGEVQSINFDNTAAAWSGKVGLINLLTTPVL